MVISGSRRMCSGALLTAAILILQVSCLLFPVLGLVFCVAGTIFSGAAGLLMGRRAVFVLLSAALLLLLFSPRYAFEFLLTTGLAGGTLGATLEKDPFRGLLISSLGLFSGLTASLYLFGAALIGGLITYLPVSACLPVFAVFSPAYCCLCRFLLKRFIRKTILRRVLWAA